MNMDACKQPVCLYGTNVLDLLFTVLITVSKGCINTLQTNSMCICHAARVLAN